jgi:hypothetical protein
MNREMNGAKLNLNSEFDVGSTSVEYSGIAVRLKPEPQEKFSLT